MWQFVIYDAGNDKYLSLDGEILKFSSTDEAIDIATTMYYYNVSDRLEVYITKCETDISSSLVSALIAVINDGTILPRISE